MIILNRLNGEEFALNNELIETIIETPDTTIKLTNGNVYLVSQSMREVIELVSKFNGRCFEHAINENKELKESFEE